mmetsp:Transcript_9736/g.26442  ORF Transcript_9736/g.26442 Transcript_9736/m.26442 type:complete len:226 (+) Transcript_9736:1293-1970(+)
MRLKSSGTAFVSSICRSSTWIIAAFSSEASYVLMSSFPYPSRAACTTQSASHSASLEECKSKVSRKEQVLLKYGMAWHVAPKYTDLPDSSIMSRSNFVKEYDDGEWIVQITVIPPDASSATAPITSFAVNESSPVVGSSRNSTRGLEMSAIPIFTRFAWPPEIPLAICDPIRTVRHCSSPSVSMTSSTAAFFSSSGVFSSSFNCAVYKNISSTVRIGTRVSNCST